MADDMAINNQERKLWDETQFPHLDVGCPLQITFRGATGEGLDVGARNQVTLGGFCEIQGKIHALTFLPRGWVPSCSNYDSVCVEMAEERQTGQGIESQPVFQLNQLGVLATGHIAAVQLRDQDTDSDREKLRQAIGGRRFMKILDISKGDMAPRVGLNVAGNMAGLKGQEVQSTQQGMRWGLVESFDPGANILKVGPLPRSNHSLVNGRSLGAFVISIGPKSSGKHDVYGIIVDYIYENDNGTALVYSMAAALNELKAALKTKMGADSLPDISLCCPP